MKHHKLLIGITAGVACLLPLLVQAQQERDRDASRMRTPASRVERSIRETRADLHEAQSLLPNVADAETREHLEKLLDHADSRLTRTQADITRLARTDAWEPMKQETFTKALDTIKEEHFDGGKLAAVLLLCKHNYYTSQQVSDMLVQFDFDEDRGKAATALYARTTDPGSFFTVLKTFKFDADKDKIREMILKQEAE